MKNFNTKLQAKIEAAQEVTKKIQEKAMEKLLDNDAFVETQRLVAAKETELQKVTEIISMLNSISPYIASDGRKFSVNVFPITVFGIGTGSIMGIISGSRSAFVDEKMMEYSAITGVTVLELYEAREALGSPTYYKDGKINDAIHGDYTKLKSILEGIFIKLNMHEFRAQDITREKYDLWFALAEIRAQKQLVEHETLQDLEANAQDFVIED